MSIIIKIMRTIISDKTIQNVNKFYASSLSLVVFLGVTTIFAAIQIGLYAGDILVFNGATISEATEEGIVGLAWLAMAISLVSCFAGFIGAIMNLRGSLSFIYWSMIQFIASAITAYFAGMWLTTVALLTVTVIGIFRYFAWKYDLINKWNLNMKWVYTWIVVFLLFVLSIFITSEVLVPELHVDSVGEVKPLWTGMFDSFSATAIIGGSILLIFKVKWSFVVFFIGKFFTIATYAQAGNLVTIIQMLLFSTMDISGFLAWSKHLVKDTITYEE